MRHYGGSTKEDLEDRRFYSLFNVDQLMALSRLATDRPMRIVSEKSDDGCGGEESSELVDGRMPRNELPAMPAGPGHGMTDCMARAGNQVGGEGSGVERARQQWHHSSA